MLESSEGGRSSESSASSSSSAPRGDHSASDVGYCCEPSADPRQSAYISDAVAGGGLRRMASPNRSSSGTASGSGSFPRRATSRCATWIRPASSAPQVTSAEALPATSAMPVIVAQRGAGSVTSRSAGVQRNVYQPGQPPRGLQTATPMTDAASAMPTPAAMWPQRRRSRAVPRKSAAVGTMSAAAATISASCQLSHSPIETPSAGGVMPRPRLLIRYGDVSSRAPPSAIPGHRRGNCRRQSHTPPIVSSVAASASTPAEPDSGPSSGRKNVAGEKSGCRPSAWPTGARTASHTSAARRATRSAGRRAAPSASPSTASSSHVTARLPRRYASSLAAPCSGGTGRTLKRSRGPAVVGSS
jgi:hypothetical protein